MKGAFFPFQIQYYRKILITRNNDLFLGAWNDDEIHLYAQVWIDAIVILIGGKQNYLINFNHIRSLIIGYGYIKVYIWI